jgi:hypothetical protein
MDCFLLNLLAIVVGLQEQETLASVYSKRVVPYRGLCREFSRNRYWSSMNFCNTVSRISPWRPFSNFNHNPDLTRAMQEL